MNQSRRTLKIQLTRKKLAEWLQIAYPHSTLAPHTPEPMLGIDTIHHHGGRLCTLGTMWRNRLRNVRWIRCPSQPTHNLCAAHSEEFMIETETTPCGEPLTAETVGEDPSEGNRGIQEIQIWAENHLERRENPIHGSKMDSEHQSRTHGTKWTL